MIHCSGESDFKDFELGAEAENKCKMYRSTNVDIHELSTSTVYYIDRWKFEISMLFQLVRYFCSKRLLLIATDFNINGIVTQSLLSPCPLYNNIYVLKPNRGNKLHTYVASSPIPGRFLRKLETSVMDSVYFNNIFIPAWRSYQFTNIFHTHKLQNYFSKIGWHYWAIIPQLYMIINYRLLKCLYGNDWMCWFHIKLELASVHGNRICDLMHGAYNSLEIFLSAVYLNMICDSMHGTYIYTNWLKISFMYIFMILAFEISITFILWSWNRKITRILNVLVRG